MWAEPACLQFNWSKAGLSMDLLVFVYSHTKTSSKLLSNFFKLVVECSERTVLSCLEPVCLCWRLPDRTPLSPKNVLDVLELLLRTTFFIFNGTYYQQTEGVAMGGPPSSIVVEIYMQATETTALTTASHPPKVWERHVDDVFSVIRKSNLT